LLLILSLVAAAASAETGINTVVGLVESRYAVRHHGVPALWLARPFLIGFGVGGLKMALFSKVCEFRNEMMFLSGIR
jgi:hypothetical protein